MQRECGCFENELCDVDMSSIQAENARQYAVLSGRKAAAYDLAHNQCWANRDASNSLHYQAGYDAHIASASEASPFARLFASGAVLCLDDEFTAGGK